MDSDVVVPKICKDCKYYRAALSAGTDLCVHIKARRIEDAELVRGPIKGDSFFLCASMRAGICGLEALLFEPRV